MQYPLFLVGLLYSTGILLGNRYPFPPGWLFLISFTLGVLCLRIERRRPWLLGLLLLFAGWTNIVPQTAIISPQDLRVLVENRTELVTVRGTLTELPRERVWGPVEAQRHSSMAIVKVDAMARKDQWEPATGRILTRTRGVLSEDYYTGQMVEISGVIGSPPGLMAKGLFDYRSYLEKLGIYYELRVDSPADWRLEPDLRHRLSPPLADRFTRWANATLGKGLPVEDEYVNLQRAMALGWKTGLTEEVSEPFMRSGTIYLFAISGLHVILVSGMLLAALRFLNVPRTYCGLIIIPLLWFYAAATGWSTSAIRATTMMTIIVGGWILKRPSNLINSLCVAAFLLLLCDPLQLFQVGFQLSFLVVLIMGLLLPKTDDLIKSRLRHDPLLPTELLPRWQRELYQLARLIAGHISVSLACWLGSLPLTAYYFHLFTPISLLTSLLVVPLALLSLMASLGSVLCGVWWATGTELFNHAGWFFMVCMSKFCTWVSILPGAWKSVRSPALVEIGGYYALLIFGLSGVWQARLRRKLLAVSAGALILVGLHFTLQPASEAQLTILAVNGGDAIFYETAKPTENLLIDCGNDSAAKEVVIPYLHSQGIDHLRQLLLTHGDVRHVGGTEIIREQLSIDQVLTSSVKSRSTPYRKIIANLEKTPERWRKIHRGDQVGPWKILHPIPEDHFSSGDDNAVVLLGELQGTRVLLVSDLGQPGQHALLEREHDLHADIVVTGIPAKGEPLDDAFLDAIKPKAIIVSCAEVPVQEKATNALRTRLAQRHVPVYYTSDVYSVTLTFLKNDWLITTARDLSGEDSISPKSRRTNALQTEPNE